MLHVCAHVVSYVCVQYGGTRGGFVYKLLCGYDWGGGMP